MVHINFELSINVNFLYQIDSKLFKLKMKKHDKLSSESINIYIL